MDEISILEQAYFDSIYEIANDLVRHNQDLLETVTNLNETEYCDEQNILDIVADNVTDMSEQKIIQLISISPTFLKKDEKSRGVFIANHLLELLWCADHDDVIHAIDNSKELFIEQHNDAYESIITDIKSFIPEMAKKYWLELRRESKC
jgi:hypothetical protein